MTAEACADLVERGDPDRWRTAMLAPPEKRPGLMALYAFNLEIARAPWVASESMLAEIRLRWWTDAVAEIYADAPLRRHEVVAPLAEMIRATAPPQSLFDEAIAARLIDAEIRPHADRDSLERYLDRTSGNLMWLAALHLGAPETAESAIRDYAKATGIAAFLRALSELRSWGREPLPPDTDIATLAADGLAALDRARAATAPKVAAPAFLAGWMAPLRLQRARTQPDAVWSGGLETSEARARAALIFAALRGRI